MKKSNSKTARFFSMSTRFVPLLLFLLSATLSMAQNNITLDMKNVTYREVFKTIEKKSGQSFVYTDDVKFLDEITSVKEVNQPLSVVLKKILQNKGYDFSIEKKHIILKRISASATKAMQKISGVVKDVNGEPLIGAGIKVKGKSLGTVSDLSGNFTLETEMGSELVVSYVGFQTKDVLVSGKNVIIILNESVHQLNELVVVGYGVQRKVNQTGAVSMIGTKELAARPIANVASGLQGLLPGVTVTNYSGKPGAAGTSVRIRGIGTLNNANPLILVDGVEGDMNLLNPDDIESVSVLKDAASSAIYGSRGANGVILITTKKATKNETATINVNAYYGIQKPTAVPEMLGAVEYMEMLTEAQLNVGQPRTWFPEDIETVRLGTDPNYMANTNWMKEIYTSCAPQYNVNISAKGGTAKMGYYASYGFLKQDGLMTGSAYESMRHNARLKVNAEVLDRVTLEGQLSYVDRNNKVPMVDDSGSGGLFYTAIQSSPLTPVRFTDGQWGYGGSARNPVALAHDGGFGRFTSQEISAIGTVGVKIIDGLNIKGQYALKMTNSLRRIKKNQFIYYYPNSSDIWYVGTPESSIDMRDYLNRYQSILAQADYEKKIGSHEFHILAGFSQEWNLNEYNRGMRERLSSESLEVLDAGTINQINEGNAGHWALRSVFGRVNYTYADKYLFEGNVRYDGTSRFYKKNRFGLFPSASLGWRFMQEDFMENAREYVDEAKLRVSYGKLGNQYVNSSLYPYLATIEPIPGTGNMPIGGNLTSSMAQLAMPNKNLRWESINMLNVGLDVYLLNSRLYVSADWFDKKTNDILVRVPLPDVIGLKEPEQNAGKVSNRGWEINLSWKDRIGKDFTYGVNFNLSDVRNKVESLGGVPPTYADQIRMVGYPIDAFYGLVADGLASVDEFTYNASTGKYTNPTFPVISGDAANMGPGDIKYKDISGPNGVPDGIISLDYDREVIGNPIPRFTYMAGGNLAWKGIDFSFSLQGVGKCDGYIQGEGRHAFINENSYPQTVHRDRWSFQNQNAKAAYPRFTFQQTHNQRFSSFWLENAAYIRLKNVQLGYTLPKKWTRKARIESCRAYVSGDNLLTFTDFFYGYDPESPVSNGGYYPQVKTLSFGLSITFQ